MSMNDRFDHGHLVGRQKEQRMLFVLGTGCGAYGGGQVANGQFAVGRLAHPDRS